MYKTSNLVVLVLAITLTYCSADESGEGMMKFQQEIKAALCKPDTATDAILDQMIACRTKDASDEHKQAFETKVKAFADECGKDKDKDISAYTKVNVKNEVYRRILLAKCCPDFQTCMKGKWMNEKKNKEKSDKPHKMPTKEQREEFFKCMKKAVGL